MLVYEVYVDTGLISYTIEYSNREEAENYAKAIEKTSPKARVTIYVKN